MSLRNIKSQKFIVFPRSRITSESALYFPKEKKTRYLYLRVHPTILTTIDKIHLFIHYLIPFFLLSYSHRKILFWENRRNHNNGASYQSIVIVATRFPFIRLLRGSSETAPSSLNADAESAGLVIRILDDFRIAVFLDRRPRHRVASLRPLSGAVTLLAVFY